MNASETRYGACNLCEAICGLEFQVQDGKVLSIRGDDDDPFSRGHVCPKAVALKDIHEDPDRLRRPLRRVGRDFVEVSWDEAYAEVEERIRAVQKRHGADAVATYFGNPTLHNYGAALFSIPFALSLKTRNRFSAASADQLPRMVASLHLYGHQALFPIPDIDRTDYFLILGANPAASNGSIMTAPDVATRIKAIRERGGKVVLLDPRRTETAALADEHHFIRPGTDALFLLALLETIFPDGLAR